ncbi:hypothetical protein JTB14_007929 [Gonioctena quinquepunctata]|nr:hypothetical protein JTB14_007929 [Gonioctena quinquepunctata]
MAALEIFGHYNVSLTEKACTCSSEKDSPSTSEEKRMMKLYPTYVHRSTERDLTVQEIEGLLKIFDKAVGLTWLLSSEPEAITESPVVGIEDIIFDETYFKTVDKMKYFCEKLQVSHEEILEGYTIWTTINLFNEGREHEAEGITAAEQASGVNVIRTGQWLHSCGLLEASPDVSIGEDTIVEVKRPFKYRAFSMMEGIKLSEEYTISADVDGNIVQNSDHEYFFHIQGQLAFDKGKICHLVICTPREVVIFQMKAEDFESNINILKCLNFLSDVPVCNLIIYHQ